MAEITGYGWKLTCKCTQQAQRCSGKFLLARVNFWSEYARFFPANGKYIIKLYQAVRGKLINGWLAFPGFVTLPSLGIFTQTDVVYLN